MQLVLFILKSDLVWKCNLVLMLKYDFLKALMIITEHTINWISDVNFNDWLCRL